MSRAAARAVRRLAALLAPALVLVSGPARADLWSIDSNISSRLESNDNPSLVTNPSGTVNSLSLTTGLKASRQTESWATGVNVVLTGVQESSGGQDRLDGSLGFTQSLSDELNTYSLGLNFTQDFNNVVQSADVTQAQGQRRSSSLTASWEHSLTERLSTNTTFTLQDTRFGNQLSDSGANDFREGSLSAGIGYRLSEIDTVSLNGQHSDYRASDDDRRSKTSSVNLGWSRTLTEDTGVSLSVGVYRTTNSSPVQSLVCPAPLIFCQVGLVPFEIVTETSDESNTGFQFSASYSLRFDEVSGFSFSASTQQSPSGAGALVTNERLSAAANRSFSETLTGSIAYDWSRARDSGQSLTTSPARQSLSVSLSRQLSPDLSLGGNYTRTQGEVEGSGGSARSNSVSISLNYQWPSLQVTR